MDRKVEQKPLLRLEYCNFAPLKMDIFTAAQLDSDPVQPPPPHPPPPPHSSPWDKMQRHSFVKNNHKNILIIMKEQKASRERSVAPGVTDSSGIRLVACAGTRSWHSQSVGSIAGQTTS
eukprot:3035667-Rhodomonas_salina.4